MATNNPYQWSKQAARDVGKMDLELQKIQRAFQQIVDEGPSIVTRLTFTEDLYSITPYATPAGFVSTTFDGFASAVGGATLMGYGSTYDVSFRNRSGTVGLGILAGTTTVSIPGNLNIAGTVSFTSTTDSTSVSTGAVTTLGGVGIAKSVFFGGAIRSDTAFATPSAFAATAAGYFASTVSGGTLMGYGTTNDSAMKNRAGTTVIAVTANTTNATVAGALTVGTNITATNGFILATGVQSQFAVTRRDTLASAWAWYSQTGSFQIFDNVAGVDKVVMLQGGAISFTNAAAAGFNVGPNGATNPAFQVDTSVGSLAAGLKVTGATSAGTVAVAVISSGSNANLSVDAKGSGTITWGGTSTGAFTFTRSSTFSNGIANAGTIAAGVWNGTAILTTFGGTGLASYSAGDMVYWASGTTFTKLAIGTAGQLLRSNGSAPTWSTATFPTGATAGDLIYGSASNVWTQLPIGSASAILQVTAGFPAWTLTPTGLTSIGATTGTFTNIGGTLSTASQPNVTTMANLTTIGTLVAGAVPASLVTAGTFGAGDYVFPSDLTVTDSLVVGADPTGTAIIRASSALTGVNETTVLFANTGATGDVLIARRSTDTAANGASWVGQRARDASASVVNNDVLAGLYAQGWTGAAWSANVGAIRVQAVETFSGGGHGTQIDFATTSVGATSRTGRWIIRSTGNLVAFTDNTYDVGQSASSNRPRTGYFGTSVVVGTDTGVGALRVTGIANIASGALTLTGTYTLATAQGSAALNISPTITAISAAARGGFIAPTLVAAANGDALTGFRIEPSNTPGAFTGLTRTQLILGAMDVSGFTSPGDPISLDIRASTGTGATNAYAIKFGAGPSGATNNYLLHATNFNVTSAGGVTGVTGAFTTRVTSPLLGTTTAADVVFDRNSVTQLTLGSLAATFAGTIKTVQPSASGAGAYKWGKYLAATVALDTAHYVEVDIDGVVYKLGVVT